MDAGVGCFVFSAGLVAKHYQRTSAVMATFRSCIPLLLLGGARVLTTKATDYQEHVSEYGVHWNFFITLAFVQVLLLLVKPPIRWSAATGFALAIGTCPSVSKLAASFSQQHVAPTD
jgi:glucosaminylphosphatidylinositol acyltransferase